MKYLIVQNWKSTDGNHAGMVHMSHLLCTNWPEEYRMIQIEEPQYRRGRNFFTKTLAEILNFFTRELFFPILILKKIKTFLGRLQKGDEIFLLEYLFPDVNQYVVAKYIARYYKGVKIYALSHLTPTFMNQHKISDKTILKWAKPIDKMLTLGSSLSNYFKNVGIPYSKISTGFHYVDEQYYRKNIEADKNKNFTIIVMGAMMRDDVLIEKIVRGINDVNWIVCFGRKKIPESFPRGENIKLLGYLPEDDLKSYMEEADASLSIMKDTIGSNVITTSFAMGLINIVSDVGSIRDYCSEKDSAICANNSNSFITTINKLKDNPLLVKEMKQNAQKKAASFSIMNVHRWFSNLKNND